MTEHLEFSWVYDTTPLEVFRMVTRLDHLEEKARHLGHRAHKMLELRERDGRSRAVTQRQGDVDLPRWAPKFVGPRNVITQTQLWHPSEADGSRRYDARVEIGGVPVTITGQGLLTPMRYNTVTRYDIRLAIHSSAPVIGHRIEAFVARQFTLAINGEHEFRLLWLGRRNETQHVSWQV